MNPIKILKLESRTAALSLAFLLAALAGPSARSAEKQPALQPIFNGKDLSGWVVPTPNLWRAENGVLIGESDAKKSGSLLQTEKKYVNFAFETEVRWNGPIDSGVFMRTPALQVQVGTSISLKKDLTGSFYITPGGYVEAGLAKEAGKYLKLGDWNTLRIEGRGNTFTVWLNGHQVSRYTDAKYAGPGPLAVQIHQRLDMKVEFRNLRAVELP